MEKTESHENTGVHEIIKKSLNHRKMIKGNLLEERSQLRFKQQTEYIVFTRSEQWSGVRRLTSVWKKVFQEEFGGF